MTSRILDRAIPRGSLGDLEAFIYFESAFDCRMGHCRTCDAGRKADHGRGSVRMNWVVRGHDFVVQWSVFTPWSHSSTPQDVSRRLSDLGRPAPTASVDYHSLLPVYDGQEAMSACSWFDGDPRCYFDGTGLVDDLWWTFTDQGDEAAWEWLATRWHDWHRDREMAS